LFFLFGNEQLYKQILNTTNLAGLYKKDNKKYYFNYTNTDTNEIVKFDNMSFYNMFKRPVKLFK